MVQGMLGKIKLCTYANITRPYNTQFPDNNFRIIIVHSEIGDALKLFVYVGVRALPTIVVVFFLCLVDHIIESYKDYSKIEKFSLA